MRLNRALQLQLLTALADRYPEPVFKDTNIEYDSKDVVRNLVYLEAHGLVTLTKAQMHSGEYVVGLATATQKGMDFLEEDGGLSAILGVVTVKLHDDTIKDLLALKIQESDLPPAEKQRWIDQLRELPAETTKHVVMKLVDLGLEKAPDALSAIGKVMGLVL